MFGDNASRIVTPDDRNSGVPRCLIAGDSGQFASGASAGLLGRVLGHYLQQRNPSTTCAKKTPQEPRSKAVVPASAANRYQDLSNLGKLPARHGTEHNNVTRNVCQQLGQWDLCGILLEVR